MRKKNSKNKKNFSIFIISLYTFFCYFSFFISSNTYGDKFFNVSKSAFNRIEGYFDKKIFSFIYNNNIENFTGLAIFITNDGQNTVLTYCRERDKFLCQINSPFLFQSKTRCEKTFKKKCQILFKENYLILKKKILIKNKKELKNYFKIVNKENIKSKHTDFEVSSSRDNEGCGSGDC